MRVGGELESGGRSERGREGGRGGRSERGREEERERGCSSRISVFSQEHPEEN